ncbi:putative AC transposase [Lucilia cuprina]|nr:putative AC transposase [Lucilia cuprina]
MPRKSVMDFEKHFEKRDEIAICKHCNKQFTTERKFNLKKHVEKVHKIVIRNEINKENAQKTQISISKYKTKNIKCEINKKLLIKSYIGLVTEDAASFNFLNSPNVRNIIDPICKGIELNSGKKFCLNATNCKKTLCEVAENIVKSISAECENRLISLKIDSASRLARNIFGISAQYIKNDEINSRILAMVELKGQHSCTSKNLAIEILNVLNKYKINLQQIVTITSDNGSNMIKSTKILSHCLSEEECFVDDTYNNNLYFETINSMECQTELLHVGEIGICRCAAHTSQLCALDTIKNANIKDKIINCRNIVKFLRKNSNGFKDLFEIKSLKLPQLDCPTRWGSTYNMIKDLQNAKEIIESVESVEHKSSDESFKINSDFWEFIDSYCIALSSLQKSIIKFQEEHLHYSDFYLQWLRCKLLTTEIIKENNTKKESMLFKISSVLLQSMEKREEKLLSNCGLLSCLYLDPRICHLLTDNQKLNAIKYLKMLWQKIKLVCGVEIGNTTTSNIITPEIRKENDDDDGILNNFLNQVFRGNEVNNVDVNYKIETLNLPYATSPVNVLNFWKDRKYSDPELYALSNVCFAIPPTQVSVERAFSSLKFVLTENRNRLSKETLDNILLVKLNPSFLCEGIDNLTLFEQDDENNEM